MSASRYIKLVGLIAFVVIASQFAAVTEVSAHGLETHDAKPETSLDVSGGHTSVGEAAGDCHDGISCSGAALPGVRTQIPEYSVSSVSKVWDKSDLLNGTDLGRDPPIPI